VVAPVVRSARSQVLFREVNERISEVLDPEGGPIQMLCECTDGGCTGTVFLERQEYDRIRSGPNHFVVLPGHERREVERIVHQSDRFVTVEKKIVEGHHGSH
jgi:hypothetical protein